MESVKKNNRKNGRVCKETAEYLPNDQGDHILLVCIACIGRQRRRDTPFHARIYRPRVPLGRLGWPLGIVLVFK